LILTFVNNLGVSTICYFVIAFPKRFFTDLGAQKLLWCKSFSAKDEFFDANEGCWQSFLSLRNAVLWSLGASDDFSSA
jgi:hypothetical protein